MEKRKELRERVKKCFFFINAKAAYGVPAGLVGSEVCIRDSLGETS